LSVAIEQRRMSLAEFLALPDEEPALELEPDGTVIQKMSPQGEHSTLQYSLARFVNAFAVPRRMARAFIELRAVYGGAAYVSDVSVYLWNRIPRKPDGSVLDDFTEPPDIAVEIASPGQGVNAQVRRCVWHVENGVLIAMQVDPSDRSVALFRAGVAPRAVVGAEAIDFSAVLPGFELTVDQLFATLRLESD
jgi:Uma2 family endonuclease